MPRRLAPVPGHQGRDDLPARPGRAVPDVLREQTGAANGQTFAADGRIVFCEQNGRRVSRMNRRRLGRRDRRRDLVGQAAEQPQRRRLPLRRPRLLHRPPLRRRPGRPRAPLPGGLRASTRGPDEPRLLLDDFEKPNGLAFSPDERTLYVCDTARYHVRAFAVEPFGRPARRLRPGLRHARPRPARRPRRDEGRPRRPGLRRRRPGRLGLRARRPPPRDPRPPQTPLEPRLVRPRRPTLAITAVDTVHLVRMRVQGLSPRFQPPIP